MNRLVLARALPLTLAASPFPAAEALHTLALGVRRASSIPRVAQPSFWRSLVPKPLKARMSRGGAPRSSEWNPATFFIVMFLLIGSMSIQMIALKKDFAAFTRQADVRIGLLREVVEKLQRGEDVDVEKVLGTGVPEKEAEWQEVLDEIEKDDIARGRKRKQSEALPANKPDEHTEQAEAAGAAAQASSGGRASFF